jgi:hypothetical protein
MTGLKNGARSTTGKLKLMKCMAWASHPASEWSRNTNLTTHAQNTTMCSILFSNSPSSSTMPRLISTCSRTPTLSTPSKSTTMNIKCLLQGPVPTTFSTTNTNLPNLAVTTCPAPTPFSFRITIFKLSMKCSPKRTCTS